MCAVIPAKDYPFSFVLSKQETNTLYTYWNFWHWN